MARRHRRPAINLTGLFAKMIVAAFVAVFTFGSATVAEASKRVALVIGNSAYKNAPALANPHNDATDIAAALNDLGFEVVVGTDLDNRGMRDTVREFGKALRGADVAMLFYAGHALQVNGKNFLAPIDTRLEFENDLDFETIPLQFIQRQMEREAKTQLLFIDACRDNPLASALKEASRSTNTGNGLAKEKLASSGILIAFATDPDNVALDGTGRNSPFTKALLDNIKRPGVEISTLMTDVRIQVRKDTDDRQTPWINSALLGRFYFNPGESQQTDQNKQVAALDTNSDVSKDSGPSRGVDTARIQSLAWDAVKDSNSISELEAFVSVYGSGFYGKLAKIRIDRLKAENAPKGETPPATEEQQIASVEKQPEPTAETREVAAPPKVDIDPRELALALQKELARLNCNPGRPDGIWGNRSQRALNSFSKHASVKLVAAQPDPGLLDQLRGYDGSGCPKVVRKKKSPPKQRQASAPAQVQTRSAAPQQQQVIQQQRQPQVIQQQRQPQVIVQQPQHQGGVIVQQPQHQGGVIVQQQPVFQPQPQRRNPVGNAIGGAIIGGIACIVTGC